MSPVAPGPRPRSPAGTGLFLKRWLRRPLHIGAVAPSGQALSRAMASAVFAEPAARQGTIVELGAGTGSFTAAVRDRGLPPERLVSIERDPELLAWLRRHFPDLRLLSGDAARLPALLEANGVSSVGVVFSGLPLLSMPRAVVRAIVGGVFEVLEPDGAFIQFTYGTASPVPMAIVDEMHLESSHGSRIWLNVPPAVVWTFRRR